MKWFSILLPTRLDPNILGDGPNYGRSPGRAPGGYYEDNEAEAISPPGGHTAMTRRRSLQLLVCGCKLSRSHLQPRQWLRKGRRLPWKMQELERTWLRSCCTSAGTGKHPGAPQSGPAPCQRAGPGPMRKSGSRYRCRQASALRQAPGRYYGRYVLAVHSYQEQL